MAGRGEEVAKELQISVVRRIVVGRLCYMLQAGLLSSSDYDELQQLQDWYRNPPQMLARARQAMVDSACGPCRAIIEVNAYARRRGMGRPPELHKVVCGCEPPWQECEVVQGDGEYCCRHCGRSFPA